MTAEPLVLTQTSVAKAAAEHYRLYAGAALLRIITLVAHECESFEEIFERFPFLADYANGLADQGLGGNPISQADTLWGQKIAAYEASFAGHLPLRALRDGIGLGHDAIVLLLACGLLDDDPRFGVVYQALNGASDLARPTVECCSRLSGYADDAETRAAIRTLVDLGLVEFANTTAPRPHWTLQQSALVSNALRGEWGRRFGTWGLFYPAETRPSLEDLVLPAPLRQRAQDLTALLVSDKIGAVLIRGPHCNGRRALAGALARVLGYDVLEIRVHDQQSALPWNGIGVLATVLHALPVLVLDIAPGESIELPELCSCTGPLFVVLGHSGGVRGTTSEHTVTVTLPIPGTEERRRHWQAIIPSTGSGSLPDAALRYRMTSGNLRRVARLAATHAQLNRKPEIGENEVRLAARTLNRGALETLAVPVDSSGGCWEELATSPQTLTDLRDLEDRCRFRERLSETLRDRPSYHSTPGVRALFKGPSGTGKTLAARLLAEALKMDLFRVNLATVVNKYIGETEKNLERVFACAEEHDVILLLDEGDALLTRRTGVQNSNDRYANLETNFLLQRIETYEGILLVTTNAGDRIDSAFQRRMDAVVDFPLPDASTRAGIWRLHLPAAHGLSDSHLSELAQRCALAGGQIRNAVLHASLLALAEDTVVSIRHLTAAVQREYRKTGAVCPLRVSVAGPRRIG